MLTGTWASWHDVLTETQLGGVLAGRIGLLVLSAGASVTVRSLRSLCMVVSVLTGLALVSFVWTGHGMLGSGGGAGVHPYADALHLLTAGLWIGALLPLSILSVTALNSRSPTDAAALARGIAGFSNSGVGAVLLLLVSGLVNSYLLVGTEHWRSVFNTPYGVVLAVKLALFGMMLGIAWRHRYRTGPMLQRAVRHRTDTRPILKQLCTTIVAETVIGLLVVVAVAILGTLEPPAA